MKALRFFSTNVLASPSKTPAQLAPSQLLNQLKASHSFSGEVNPTDSIKRDLETNEKRLVYVKFLPKEWSEVQIQKYFDPKIQKINGIQLTRNRLGESTGRALLWLRNESEASKFIELFRDDCIETKDIVQKIDVKPFELKRWKAKEPFKRNTRVTIRNIAPQVTEKDIEELAKPYGKILKLHLPSREERHFNFGYVIYEKASSAERFYNEEQGTRMLGKELK